MRTGEPVNRLTPGSDEAAHSLSSALRSPPCRGRSNQPGTATWRMWAGRRTGRNCWICPRSRAGCLFPPCQRSTPQSGGAPPTAAGDKMQPGSQEDIPTELPVALGLSFYVPFFLEKSTFVRPQQFCLKDKTDNILWATISVKKRSIIHLNIKVRSPLRLSSQPTANCSQTRLIYRDSVIRNHLLYHILNLASI